MFKKLLFASIAVCVFTSQSFADNFYTGKQIGAWTVFGNPGSQSQNPACVAETIWEDGSKMQLIKDLTSGEIYIWFQNYAWNIGDAPGDYPFRMNFHDREGHIVGGDLTYSLINKNTISIRALDAKSFIPAFMEMGEIRIMMPGDIGNAIIPLQGSTAAVQQLLDCMDAAKNAPPPASTVPAPQQQKVPGQDI